MKPQLALAALLSCFLFGCASTPPPPRPFFGILDARKVSEGPAESAKYEVVVRYENVVPGKHEVKIGFGYTPREDQMHLLSPQSAGVYAIAHTEILQKESGDLRVTLEPTTVRNVGGKMNGRIHAILSDYPHGPEWPVIKHDVFVLP
jgi:hypothetical protein